MSSVSYFPGSNTCRGFHGYFQELLPDDMKKRVYIIKGGPGVGKSTLMRRIGAAWEKQGRQVQYFWCSGDPDSLDAVIADGCMLMDGTAPHVTDPTLPGAADGIINLGECLDEAIMAAHREDVLQINRDIRRCYSRAYHYLTGADAALRDMQEIYAQAVDEGALINLRLELMAFMQGMSGRSQHAYAQAITCKGVVGHLNSARGVGYLACMQPLDGKKHAHLMTDSCAVCSFVEKGCETRTLPFDEKILRREHEQLAFNRAAYDLLLNQALSALHDAKEKHDVLERIYADAMDYRKLDDMQGNMVQRMTKA